MNQAFLLFSPVADNPTIVALVLDKRPLSTPPLKAERSMAMNGSRILTGGLVAGVVMNIMDFISNGVLFADRMKAESNAFKAGLGDQMAAMNGKQVTGYVIMDLVVGGILVWAYAAMRPRFGAGPKTAVMVALAFWIFGAIVAVNYMNMGIMSSGLWIQFAAFYFVSLLIAALAGGAVYKEEGTAG